MRARRTLNPSPRTPPTHTSTNATHNTTHAHPQGESELEEVERELADGRGSRDRLKDLRDGDSTKRPGGRGGAGAVAHALACIISPVRRAVGGGRRAAGLSVLAAAAARLGVMAARRSLPSPAAGRGAAAPPAHPAPARPRAPSQPLQHPFCPLTPRTPSPPQIFLNAFTLTFLAEWGDRSQIATIGLAASSDVFGVTLGSIVGHAACTAAAVLGGRHLATHINEKTVGVSARVRAPRPPLA